MRNYLLRLPVLFLVMAAGKVHGVGEYDVNLPAPLSPPEKMENIKVAPGPFEPTWDSLQAYRAPDWFKDAKFGIWAHWGPQAEGEAGDWYARSIYEDGEAQQSHLKRFGHPSDVGYMQVLNAFKAEDWDPEELMALYKKAGARYFMAMGCHHDNVDCWNSKYQPWNTVNFGPHKDIVGLWEKAAREQGMHFGVSFHADYSWWWYQDAFLNTEKTGPKAGVPFDAARLTKADGQGQWWQGLDPKDLYGKSLADEVTKGKWLDPSEKDGSSRYGDMADEISDKEYARWYCTKWCHRVQDLIHNYHPDLLYFDGGGGNYYPFSGVGTGRGFASDAMQRITADFYNTNLAEHDGKMDAVLNLKTDKGNAIVLDYESGFPGDIPDRPWQTDNTIGDWFYRPDCFYDTGMVIHELLEVVSRGGNLMMNVMLSPEGRLDPQGRQTLEDMAQWMGVNSEGIFGTHAWKIWGEGFTVMRGGILNKSNAMTPYTTGDIRFTQSNDGQALYAYCMKVPDAGAPGRFDLPAGRVVIRALASGSPLVSGEPTGVSLLGYGGTLKWARDEKGLAVELPAQLPGKYALCFKITGLTTTTVADGAIPSSYLQGLRERPSLVAASDGSFYLSPNDATTEGPTIQLELSGGICNFGYWRSAQDKATWQIQADKPGAYRVVLDMATPEKDIDLVADAGSEKLAAKLSGTGGYDQYKPVEIGTINIAEAGRVLVSLHGDPAGNWKPINLRGVRLVPAG